MRNFWILAGIAAAGFVGWRIYWNRNNTRLLLGSDTTVPASNGTDNVPAYLSSNGDEAGSAIVGGWDRSGGIAGGGADSFALWS